MFGRIAVGVGLAFLLAACGSTEGSEVNRAGIPTTVVGPAGGQVTVAPTVVYRTVTRAATATRTVSATPGATPTR
jgi:hypothetical protein